MSTTTDIKGSGRLASLDAVRGFDMFFIMGGEGLVVALATLFGVAGFHETFGHVPWDGLHFMDTVFPTFLFLAGVTFPFSVAKSRERGASDLQIRLKALRRCALLILLGLIHDGPLLRFDFEHLRVWSVLGRIGIAWFAAALIYLGFRTKARIGIAVAILLGTVLFTRFMLAPDAPVGASPFSPEGNFGCWLDRTLTGGHTYKKLFDPEGFAGILPAIVTAMLGMFTGELVRRADVSPRRKCLELAGLGIGLLVLGLAISPVSPINKALWSPSFVLVVGAYSALLFLAFYAVIDVWGYTKWSFPLKVIGMNSIAIYMAQSVIGAGHANDFLFSWAWRHLPEDCADLKVVLMKLGYVTICWLFLYFLYRKNTFLKV